MKSQFKWFTLSLLITMIFGVRAQAAETTKSSMEDGGDVTLLQHKSYTLVVKDYGNFFFDNKTLIKSLPAHASFYIKDSYGREYHAADENINIIKADNHKNLNTSKEGGDFYISKANKWMFTITDDEHGNVEFSVTPIKKGETKYMISKSLEKESEDVFVENKLTKEMTTEPFYIIRSDDYGIFELTAADRNDKEGYCIWEFSEDNNTSNFIPNERRNMYRMNKEGMYTFTLDMENNAVTAKLCEGKEYTLVTEDGNEYAFDKLTLTQELTASTEFYIKDNKGNMYYAEHGKNIISAENHENMNTYYPVEDDTPADNPEKFYFMKGNTWNFTITEPTDEGANIKLTVTPQTEGETKYMLSATYLTKSEDIFDENLMLTKEMEAGKAFYIERSDDYGITNMSAADANATDGTRNWDFSETANQVGFVMGEITNVYRMTEAGTYTFTLDLEQNTVSFSKILNSANDGTSAVTSIYSDDNWSIDKDGAWYTIDGRQCNGKPMQKGLYIHNGRKVTIM